MVHPCAGYLPRAALSAGHAGAARADSNRAVRHELRGFCNDADDASPASPACGGGRAAGSHRVSHDHDRLAAIAGYILARQSERITNRDVQRGDRTMRKLTRHDTDSAFEQLEALGWLTRTAGPRLTDPPHWIVNPVVHQRFSARAREERERREATVILMKGLS